MPSEKRLKPTQRRALAQWFVTTFATSIQHARRLAGLNQTAWYRPGKGADQTALRMRIREIAYARLRYGATRIGILPRREGWRVNHKRVHRLYYLEGLQVRMRVKRRKHMALHRGPAPIPTANGDKQLTCRNALLVRTTHRPHRVVRHPSLAHHRRQKPTQAPQIAPMLF